MPGPLDTSAQFSAREVAFALGLDPQSAHGIYRELEGVPHAGMRKQRGGETRTYTSATIERCAPALYCRLVDASRRDSRASVHHLLAHAADASRVQPQLAAMPSAARRKCERTLGISSRAPMHLVALPPHEHVEVQRRVRVFAPLLAARRSESIADLARTARERFAAEGGKVWSVERLRKMLAEAVARDAGRGEWEREGLYADASHLRPHRAASAAAHDTATPAASVELPAIDDAIALLHPERFLTGKSADEQRALRARAAEFADLGVAAKQRQFWDAMEGDLISLCVDGMNGTTARRHIVEHVMRNPSPFRWKTVESGLAVWLRRDKAGAACGGAPLADGRASNGRAAFFSADDEPANRDPADKTIYLSKEGTAALRLLVLQKRSFPVAVEWFVKRAACPPTAREFILAELDRAARLRREPHWPESLRRAGLPTIDEKLAFRGRKASMAVEFTDRRSLEIVDEDGSRFGSRPNDIWESDDMSSNEPFTWREGDALRIGRQTLCTLDVYSAKWLGVHPVGRERDAYRAEDIADHLAECVRAHGLPRFWRLERGPWENSVVDGVLIGRDAAGREIRWGGLDPLIKIVRAWKSRQKGLIESRFNLLQDFLAHESTSIGRRRGEFEAQTKLYLAAARGDAAAWAKFWPMDACADSFSGAMQYMNARPMKRRAHGRELVVADDLYRGAPRREVPAGEWWRFLPEKRQATVRAGHIECVSKHYPLPFRFRVNGAEEGLHLEHGYPVLIAFHPGQPEDGCYVFNACAGPRNREGRKFGDFIVRAPMAEDAPQVNLAPHERAFHARCNANAAVRTAFRAIGAQGVAPARVSVARDGWGNSLQVGAEPATRAGRIVTPHDRQRKEGEDAIRRAQRLAAEDRNESDELARIEALEAAAISRGDIIAL